MKMHRILILLLLGLLPMALPCAAEEADAETDADKSLRIASYNINYGNMNLPAVVAAIRQADADIVALQETNRKSEQYLRKHLRKLYPKMYFRHARRAGGFAFLAKAPLQNVRYLPRSKGWFGAYLATARLGEQDIQLVNVHLQPTCPEPGEGMVSYLRRWKQDQAIRREEAKHLYEQLPEETPAVVLGDFNSVPGNSVAKFLAAREFIDSYEAVTPAEKREHTWHWTTKAMTWAFRLDYLYHTAELTTQACRIVRSEGSDHDLLVSTLAWTPTTAETLAPTAATQPGEPEAAAEETPPAVPSPAKAVADETQQADLPAEG